MRLVLLLMAAVLLSSICDGQYYYNDIVTARLSQQQYMALKTNHIVNVSAASFEGDGTATENFKLEQQIAPGAQAVTIYTSFPSSGATVTQNIYSDNRLTETTDSSDKVISVSKYQYDASGKIISILIETDDTSRSNHSEELHQWFYKGDQPAYMLKIKDHTDTTYVEFTYDEQGNAGQENWKKKGKTIESYYYYYNAQKQLTDIVRFNTRAKKMLPDFLFEYDAEGRVTQMTQVPAGSSNYVVWKYVYNSKGLKQRELCLDKKNTLVGRIEYSYQ